jgi:hypothetical protein
MKMSDEERKEKKRLYNKKYRERNAEVIKKKRDEKREEQIAYLKKWRKENKDKIKEYNNKKALGARMTRKMYKEFYEKYSEIIEELKMNGSLNVQ